MLTVHCFILPCFIQSPGMYYMKAILKEYEFSPASIEVQVKEGVTENVTVLGKRIAYR